ncbi:MAG: type II 3-dehydroquinate dehydratase [Candidatus Zixiibacteriota bacterium]
MSRLIVVINGPNLDRLGKREPEVYGRDTLEDINARIAAHAKSAGLDVEFFQSNHEGDLIDCIHDAADSALGIILNPGGLTHTSVALRDAVSSVSIPVIEVHISNIFAREPFRHQSMVSGACRGVISGLGATGYILAVDYLKIISG